MLQNSVKFTPPGGVITVRTRNPADKKGALVVEIADTGIGIEPEMLGKVFDAFTQGEHSSAHRFGGLGLGLAITQRLIELQNGKISAESLGRNRGTTFRVEFPLAPSKVRPADEPTAGPSVTPSVKARRILLVEDHEQTRSTLAQLLGQRSHSVVGVTTAAAAREIAAARRCDLVISDLGLPDGDGYALMAELRDAYGLPGIALSGYGTEEDVKRSLTSGFFAHLTKPVDIHTLRRTVETALRECGEREAVRLFEAVERSHRVDALDLFSRSTDRLARQNRIRELVGKSKQRPNISALARQFNVARRTIIRDLQELIRRGQLKPEVYPEWEDDEERRL